ncbi:unnamed protein product, partial [Lymnaea stagnalis]
TVLFPPGFKETINVSLMGLAISDLMSLVTSLWTAICWTPAMYYAELPFVPQDVDYMTGSLPHLLFTRVTGWITAFVACERCLCVTVPLKVKAIITPRLVKRFVVLAFVAVTVAQSPSFYTSSLEWVLDEGRNRTVLARVVRAMSEETDAVTYSVNLVSPFASFALVLASTVVTAVQLKQKSQWRMKSASAGGVVMPASGSGVKAALPAPSKDQKVVKMVVVLSVVFIVSFLPTNVIHIFYCTIVDSPHLLAVYIVYISVTFSFIKVLECFNASISIVLYYLMSSKYRSSFVKLFRSVSGDKRT